MVNADDRDIPIEMLRINLMNSEDIFLFEIFIDNQFNVLIIDHNKNYCLFNF